MTLRIGSINLNKRLGGQEARSALERWLSRHGVDLIVVQEPVGTVTALPDTIGQYRFVGGNEQVAAWLRSGLPKPGVMQMGFHWQRIRFGGLTIFNVYLSHESTSTRAAQLRVVEAATAEDLGVPAVMAGDFNIAPTLQDGLNNGQPSSFNTKTDRGALQSLMAGARLADLLPVTGREFTIEQTIGAYHTQFRSDLALVSDSIVKNAILRYDHSVRKGSGKFTDHSGLILDLDLSDASLLSAGKIEPTSSDDAAPTVRAYETAIKNRTRPSKPAEAAVGAMRALGLRSILDFGCGMGTDVNYYRSLGIEAVGYDIEPSFGFATPPSRRYDLVVMGYVLNVLGDEPARVEAIRQAKQYLEPGGALFVVTRTATEIAREARRGNWEPFGDGFWSNKRRGMFQHGMTHDEILRLGYAAGLILHEAHQYFRVNGASSCLLRLP